MAIPFRAAIDIAGVGTLEANPFARIAFSRGRLPDGTFHKETLQFINSRWTLEREATGWVARDGRRDRGPVHLEPNTPRSMQQLTVTLRPLDLPLVVVRARLGEVALIDVPWRGCARRLGIHRGRLVECAQRVRPLEPPVAELEGAVAYAARAEIPLLWLLDAGVRLDPDALAEPGEGVAAETVVVDLDGNLRVISLGDEDIVARGPRVRLDAVSLHPGLVEGMFPERVAEWRNLEEQAAIGVS
jgi:hypothetical protein